MGRRAGFTDVWARWTRGQSVVIRCTRDGDGFPFDRLRRGASDWRRSLPGCRLDRLGAALARRLLRRAEGRAGCFRRLGLGAFGLPRGVGYRPERDRPDGLLRRRGRRADTGVAATAAVA